MLTNIWIVRGGVSPWPSRSPDLTPLDFSVWSLVKDQVYHAPLPKSIPELKSRITTALGLIDVSMLTNIWIGRGGVSPWLSRSPDFTPLDFSV
ncbi:hypothetical protein AVEN_38022-1 [Araneus ventricosus]|uniref:Uncharacterized protein n=1 Tax=Araneus ventricosus TaxID=182803 RepID=A0A4Y2MFV9_ARAVE|nr:hypothetical protein AVEN_38022-1 [Araneus ventricosus]